MPAVFEPKVFIDRMADLLPAPRANPPHYYCRLFLSCFYPGRCGLVVIQDQETARHPNTSVRRMSVAHMGNAILRNL